jgi:hypothetical protein
VSNLLGHREVSVRFMTSLRESLQNVATIEPGDSLTSEKVTSADTYLQVRTLVPKFITFRGRVDLGNSSRRDFNIFFVARNCALRKTTDY